MKIYKTSCSCIFFRLLEECAERFARTLRGDSTTQSLFLDGKEAEVFLRSFFKQHFIIITWLSHLMLDSIIFFVVVLLCNFTVFSQPTFANDGRFIREPVFGTDMYIIEAGPVDGPTVLLVHGLGDDGARLWDPWVPLLAQRYHVLAFDLPGFGRSGGGNALYSPENYARLLHWLIKTRGNGKARVVGHSMGGTIALWHAATYPEDVARLVLVDAAGILHRTSFVKNTVHVDTESVDSPLRRPLEKLNRITGRLVEKLESSNSSGMMHTLLDTPELRKAVVGGKPATIAALAAAEADFSETLSSVTVPTFLIWGELDEIAPLRTALVLAAHLRDVRYTVIPKAGHVVMRDRPEAFRKALMDALLGSLPQGPAITTPEKAVSRGDVTFTNLSDMVLDGIFDTITLDGCRNVTLQNLRARTLLVRRTEVVLKNCIIEGGDGVQLTRAALTGTNVRISAPLPVRSSQSRMDLAGAELIGKTHLISTSDDSYVLFSVSRGWHDGVMKALHGACNLTPQNPL